MENIIYNIYGSKDSTDIDAVIFLDTLPELVEERKNLTNDIKRSFGPEWNMILAKVSNGIIVDCTYPKSSPDSLNNALFTTYSLHDQKYPLQTLKKVDRNVILCIYRCINIILTHITRTHYRSMVRPTMNYSFGLDTKLENLLKIDFSTILDFNQRNTKNEDIWKIFAFYVVQANALLTENVELYTKQDIAQYESNSTPFLYRHESLDKSWLTEYIHNFVKKIQLLDYKCEGQYISYNDQIADMKNLI